MARRISAFGVACNLTNPRAPLCASSYLHQLPARQASCSCRCGTPTEQCFRKTLRSRRPPVRCAAWGRKRSKPATPNEDSNSTSGTDTVSSSAGNSKEDLQAAATQGIEDINDVRTIANNLEPKTGKQWRSRGASWEDWEDWDPDWEGDPGDQGPPDQFRKNNPRRGMGSKTPRDEYLRPMIDTLGIQYRLGFKQLEAEERVQTEFETNQWESREAVKFSAILLVAPLLTGWILGAIIANPVFTAIENLNPHAFEISERQKIEGAKDIHKAEMRMRMDAAIGRAPPLSYTELQAQLKSEAHELVEQFTGRNKHNVLNAVSDSITAFTGFGILLKDTEGRGILFRTLGRIFGGLSDTAKAFMIIASTDILLGYHSEEGWTAAIRLITNHYGSETEEAPIYTFVAIVPVTLDAIFKYWIFKGLNRKNPAAAVTLKNMDRH